MKKHTKKMIAPILITVLFVLYYAAFGVGCLVFSLFSLPWMLALGLIPLALAGACIYVLVERIKEIRSGEEDDLSQY